MANTKATQMNEIEEIVNIFKRKHDSCTNQNNIRETIKIESGIEEPISKMRKNKHTNKDY